MKHTKNGKSSRFGKAQGFTLLELMMAFLIFTIVLAATAQGLISFYVAMDIQNRRAAALSHCGSVLSGMRQVRDAKPNEFPAAIFDEFPEDTPLVEYAALENENVWVGYADAGANPLEVNITSTWTDLRGRVITSRISTLLTDR